MYIGIVQTYSPNNPIIHLLHVIPALFVTTLGYFLGLKNVRIMSVFELKRPEKSGSGSAKKDTKQKIDRGSLK